MARASNIYLVVHYDYEGYEVLAAFTVKHEMVSWLRKQTTEALEGCDVIRMPDGRYGESQTYTIEELIG